MLLALGLLGSLFFNFVALAGAGLSSMEDIAAGAGPSGVRPKRKYHESLEAEGRGRTSDRIVHIDMEGVIASGSMGDGLFASGMPQVDGLKRALEQAVNDKRVKGIVLRVNSPGGEVTASDIMFNAVRAAAKQKPVVVYMDSMAASGGYYLSCGATKIVASETTLTGSIGVIMEGFSYHGLFDKLGLGTNTFTSGPMKDMLSGARPMRDDEKAYVQGMVNSMYDRFLTVVSEGRKIPKDVLRNGVADGRVVDAREALKAKLVDQIGYIEDAYQEARVLAKAPNAMVVRYTHEIGLFDLLGASAESRSRMQPGKVEVQLPGTAGLPQMLPGRAYYLPSGFMH